MRMTTRWMCGALVIVLTLMVGCVGASSTPTQIPPSATPAPSAPTATPVPPIAPPTATPTPVPVEPITPDMVLVEAGTFEMGSTTGRPDEQPVHTVQITRPFYIARYEVTFAEYDLFCADTVGKSKPSDHGQGRGNRPVTGVKWFDAVAYCNWLSEKEGLTPCYSGKGRLIQCDFAATGYRLPTEAEWEYAARGGRLSQGYVYAGSDDPDAVAWYAANSDGTTHPVGQKQPNELGLYDMSGNSWERCWDLYNAQYYASAPASDPTGPANAPAGGALGQERVRRGGNCLEDQNLRVTCRSSGGAKYAGNNGFRLVRTKG